MPDISSESTMKTPTFDIIKFTVYILIAILGFLAFALSLRQVEFQRFATIKPVFEIIHSTENQFKLINHGGTVFFVGCDNPEYHELSFLEKITTFPDKYSAVEKNNKQSNLHSLSRNIDFVQLQLSEYLQDYTVLSSENSFRVTKEKDDQFFYLDKGKL